MNDMRVGAAFRAVRIRRRWRQQDVATRAGVSQGFVSLVERGHVDRVSLARLRTLGRALDIRIDVQARWRGGELDRLLNARHSALHESVARYFASLEGWELVPEVSFSVFGERGVIDILAWHRASGCLIVIEIKTAVVDVNELIGGMDRKRRLAGDVARARGWQASSISSWVIVTQGRPNSRRLATHRVLLRNAFPQDGRTVGAWLRDPSGVIRALSMWPLTTPGDGRTVATAGSRVREGREAAL